MVEWRRSLAGHADCLETGHAGGLSESGDLMEAFVANQLGLGIRPFGWIAAFLLIEMKGISLLFLRV